MLYMNQQAREEKRVRRNNKKGQRVSEKGTLEREGRDRWIEHVSNELDRDREHLVSIC